MDRPAWLDDYAEVCRLLHMFVDKLDQQPAQERSRDILIGISKTSCAALYKHDQRSDEIWQLIHSLQNDYHIWLIELNRKVNPADGVFHKARLRFKAETELMLRQWLQRPRPISYAQQWRDAVAHYAHEFTDQGYVLAQRPVEVSGHSANEIVLGFVRLKTMITQGHSLRKLSAMAFFGHSKLLDTREDLLLQLYPQSIIKPRRTHVEVYLPSQFDGVVFIENQDSFDQAVDGDIACLQDKILVYSVGFRASATAIRQREHVRFAFIHGSAIHEQAIFFRFWYKESSETELPCWFWGDLDFSAMGILKALRQSFPHISAWHVGYEPMLARLKSKQGHVAQAMNKENQKDPQHTGCNYADEQLLPALREHQAFVDQEMFVA